MSETCRTCQGPIVQAEGMTVAACVLCLPASAPLLDWSTAAHWSGGPARPCRICGSDALLLDRDGVPCHKTCAEAEIRHHARRIQASNQPALESPTRNERIHRMPEPDLSMQITGCEDALSDVRRSELAAEDEARNAWRRFQEISRAKADMTPNSPEWTRAAQTAKEADDQRRAAERRARELGEERAQIEATLRDLQRQQEAAQRVTRSPKPRM